MGLAYPFHDYDTAMFAPVCAMTGLLSLRRQMMLLPAFIVISRMQIVAKLLKLIGAADSLVNPVVGAIWLYVVIAIACWVGIDSQRRDFMRPSRSFSSVSKDHC